MIRHSKFKPPWWLRNSHLQTIWPSLAKREASVDITHQRLDLPDGDFLDLAWVGEHHPDKPIIIVLHGLCGSLYSPYILNTLEAIDEAGYRGVMMHFRGCSEEPNRLLRSFHAGDTTDFDFLVKYLQRKEPTTTLAAVGYSLGGNVLLKWLGETQSTDLAFAVGISVPFDLYKVLKRFGMGVSRLYSYYLLKSMHDTILPKLKDRPIQESNYKRLRKAWRFPDFDNTYTAPIHGFEDADDYYTRASCKRFLKYIQVPTLILHAKDDPFMTPDCLPDEEELSSYITLEVSDYGGHVGFVTSKRFWQTPRYWLKDRLKDVFAQNLD